MYKKRIKAPKQPSEPALVFIKNCSYEGAGAFETLCQNWKIPYWIVDLSLGDPLPQLNELRAVVILGGPASANDESPEILAQLDFIKELNANDLPILGICLGMQLLAKANGAKVQKHALREVGILAPDNRPYGVLPSSDASRDALFVGYDKVFAANRVGVNPYIPLFQLHGETILAHDTIQLLASGIFCTHQIIKTANRAWGIQGHVEIDADLLEALQKEDTFLGNLDRISLSRQFFAMKNEYLLAATMFFGNFLIAAGYTIV